MVSIDLQQLDFEDQSGVWRDDRWETTRSVCEVRRHGKLSYLTKRELGDPLVPPLDHATNADLCNKRTASVSTGIELLSVGECSHIVNRNGVTTVRKVFVISGFKTFDSNAHGA